MIINETKQLLNKEYDEKTLPMNSVSREVLYDIANSGLYHYVGIENGRAIHCITTYGLGHLRYRVYYDLPAEYGDGINQIWNYDTASILTIKRD